MNTVLKLLGDRIGTKNNEQIFTPMSIAQDAIDKIPEDIFHPDASFLDFCCKSGTFLQAIYNRLMKSKFMIEKFSNSFDRHKFILDKQLFGISPTEECRLVSIRTVHGTLDISSHIICLGGDYLDIMRNVDGKRTVLYKTIEKEFKRVRFNIVATNPPYNRGMDIDFINLAYNISTDYVVAITPAKWQTAEADHRIQSAMSYGNFRKELVPHMKYVCFYPDCLDVFGIQETSGVTWYILDKNNKYQDDCTVENKSVLQPKLNTICTRNILNGNSLWNIGNKIVEYLGNYSKFACVDIQKRKDHTLAMNKQMVKSTGISGVWDWEAKGIKPECIGKGGVLFDTTGNVVVTGGMRLLKKSDASPKECKDIFTSDDINECKSFYSWFETKFTRFFILINISSLRILNSNSLRLVPAPPSGKFDHIYTDEELYKAFNLPQEYIDVIEAVIKERK